MATAKKDPLSPLLGLSAINIIALIAFGSIVIRPFLLDIPQPFPGFARAGEVWNNLALAFLGAWFFNLLVVEIPKREATLNIMRAYNDDLREVSTKGNLILKAIANKKLSDVPSEPTLEDVRDICKSVHRGSRSPYYTFRGFLTSETLDWVEYCESHLDSADRANARLVPALPYLSPETISLLQSVRNTEFEQFIRQCSKHALISDTLEPLAPSLHKYVSDCRQLEIHLGLS